MADRLLIHSSYRRARSLSCKPFPMHACSNAWHQYRRQVAQYGYDVMAKTIRVTGRKCTVHRFFIGTWNMKGFLNEDRPVQTLRQVLTKLQNAYCSTTGYEVRSWLRLSRCRAAGYLCCNLHDVDKLHDMSTMMRK